MWIVGIVGGIGSGKSHVARELERLGATRIDADQLGHALWSDPTVRPAAIKRWGNAILADAPRTPGASVSPENSSGNITPIDRSKVAAIVFAGTPESDHERAFLDQLMRPLLDQRLREELGRLQASGVGWVVLDAALLFEAGWNDLCDAVFFVEASPECRFRRWRRREVERGIVRDDRESHTEWKRREQTQWSPNRKRWLADAVIKNESDDEPPDVGVVVRMRPLE